MCLNKAGFVFAEFVLKAKNLGYMFSLISSLQVIINLVLLYGRKLIDNQFALSDEERDRILQEHEKQMVTLSNRYVTMEASHQCRFMIFSTR